MRKFRSFIKARKARLEKDDSGVAFLEFALALPFLIVTFLGGMELVNLAVTHQQLSRVATTTSDLAARFRESIDETDVQTLLLGARLGMELDEFDERGNIILSSITAHPPSPPASPGGEPTYNGHEIRWQRCEGDLADRSVIGKEFDGRYSDGEPNPSKLPLVNGMQVLWPNTVMFAEVNYEYEPLVGGDGYLAAVSDMFRPRMISYRAAFIARELSLQNITDTTGLAASDLSDCAWNDGSMDENPGDADADDGTDEDPVEDDDAPDEDEDGPTGL